MYYGVLRVICRDFQDTTFENSNLLQKRTMASITKKNLTLDNMNPCIKRMEYAVRGPLVIRANEILNEIDQVFIKLILKLSCSRTFKNF